MGPVVTYVFNREKIVGFVWGNFPDELLEAGESKIESGPTFMNRVPFYARDFFQAAIDRKLALPKINLKSRIQKKQLEAESSELLQQIIQIQNNG